MMFYTSEKEKISLGIIFLLLLIIGFVIGFYWNRNAKLDISNFEECAQAGYPIMESYPRRCSDGDQTFTEIIDEENNVACTLEAMECPDGSYVGRVPPTCEFAPCPGE